MGAQEFAQAGIIFIGGVTCINILITFVQLCIEERKKCSIIEKEGKNVKLPIGFMNTKKKYAVLKPTG